MLPQATATWEGPARGLTRDVLRVLVVEDSVHYAALLEELLEEFWPGPLAVDHATDIAAAREALAGAAYGCVLLDLSLPDSSGLASIAALSDVAIATPVVVLTGLDDEEAAVSALERGAQEFLVKSDTDGPALCRAVRHAIERKRSEGALSRMATTDPLTGLANRALLLDRLRHGLARTQRTGDPLAVLFLDLDGFKTINDSLGHDVGDDVLREVAVRLARVVRPSDTLARFGGDEFVVVCEQAGTTAAVGAILERLEAALSGGVELDGRSLPLCASVGVALGAGGDIAPGELLRRADLAMYEAKQVPGFACRAYEAAMHTRVVQRLNVSSELDRAIDAGEIEVHYQPILDLATLQVVAVEALARWNHPDRGLLPAAEFVPHAEASGAIAKLGAWTMATAVADFATWPREAAGWSLSLNVSPQQLAVASFPRHLARLLADAGVDPERIILEVTESGLADRALGDPLLDAVIGSGVHLALDGFGAGYSTLALLGDLPVEIVKIHRDLLDVDGPGDRKRRLLRGVLDLTRSLGVLAVAVGVQTPGVLEELRRMGCPAAQGHLLGRPGPGVPAPAR